MPSDEEEGREESARVFKQERISQARQIY